MIRFTTFCGLVLALTATATAQEKKDVPKEFAPFQGTWKVLKAEKGGNPVPATTIESLRFTFAGDKVIVQEGKKEKETASFSVDAKKDPGEINIVSPDGDNFPGIYTFDKDGKLTLTIVRENGAVRPTTFDTKDMPRALLVVMEKEKK